MTAPYRKLPGTRRGFIQKSSVWAGPDHLLLVRGSRFRDEYKRFYYRDVQAMAVARAPRFHVSTRLAAIAFACWVAAAVVQFGEPNREVGRNALIKSAIHRFLQLSPERRNYFRGREWVGSRIPTYSILCRTG